MIKVKLLSTSSAKPLDLASHAALKCYQSHDPEWGKVIDVENRLFKVGHHTTLEHSFFTFSIEGISVGDITFGMHLAHPFYNSDQRSGRYCAKMFLEPDFHEIEDYIKKLWPEVKTEDRKKTMAYVKKGVRLYHDNIKKATETAVEFLKKERPNVSEKYIELNAPKIAQEQMRMFIPLIFPTGFDFSVDLVALAAMNRVAWSPSMRFILGEMTKEVSRVFPELKFMFEEKGQKDWAMALPKTSSIKIKYKPVHKLLNLEGEKEFSVPKGEMMHPVDLLHFLPEMMDNSAGGFTSMAEMSAATMGQDQRHRTVRRGKPEFSGGFYLPPVPRKLKLEKEARELMENWIQVSKKLPGTLSMILAPYGVMVKYKKSGSYNALAHEQAKRLCFCAQEEIYHLGRALRLDLEKKRGRNSKFLQLFEPPCYRTGRCVEGARYCGRDLKLRKTGDYFPERRV